VRQVTTVRLPPETLAEVRRYSDSFTVAVEQGLALWLTRERRKAEAKPRASRKAA